MSKAYSLRLFCFETSRHLSSATIRHRYRLYTYRNGLCRHPNNGPQIRVSCFYSVRSSHNAIGCRQMCLSHTNCCRCSHNPVCLHRSQENYRAPSAVFCHCCSELHICTPRRCHPVLQAYSGRNYYPHESV